MIAYAFPPLNGSGVARPFYFAKHLRDFGYAPTVITRPLMAHSKPDFESLAQLKKRCDILKAQPWDRDDWAGWVRKRFGWLDIPFGKLGLGDHVVSERLVWGYRYFWPGFRENLHWVWPAVICGLNALRKQRFDLIWATGDPWPSLQAGYWLSRLSGKPFVADIRDPWTYGALWAPYDQGEVSRTKRWEKRVINQAARIISTSPLTADIMRLRVGKRSAQRIVAITNGFSELDGNVKRDLPQSKCVFCYAGKLSQNHRNPDILLRGLRRACQDSELARDVRLQFIGKMANFDSKIPLYGLEEIVLCSGVVPLAESKAYMRGSDVLLLLQTIKGSGSDVISGKAYEYMAARKAILAIVAENGGDAWLIRQTGCGLITGIEDEERVAEGIRHFWQLWKNNKLDSTVDPKQIERFSRYSLTKDLAKNFDEILTHSRNSNG